MSHLFFLSKYVKLFLCDDALHELVNLHAS